MITKYAEISCGTPIMRINQNCIDGYISQSASPALLFYNRFVLFIVQFAPQFQERYGKRHMHILPKRYSANSMRDLQLSRLGKCAARLLQGPRQGRKSHGHAGMRRIPGLILRMSPHNCIALVLRNSSGITKQQDTGNSVL
jgi:hypothetical protein